LFAATAGIAPLLRGYSIEVNPSESKVIEAAPSRLEPGTEIYLTWIPGTDPLDMVGPAAKMRRAGLFPVPHIGARHIESEAQLEMMAGRLANEAGVDRVLIVGGDRDKPTGPYDSSLAVMQSGLLQAAGITRIAMGGFPEGNPHISDDVLELALKEKADFAHSTGLQFSIVTQFCFDAEPIVLWLQRIRSIGIDAPVRIGVAGPAGLLTLTRYAIRCGVGNSVKILTEKPSFAKLLMEKGPEPIIQGVASAFRSTNGLPSEANIVGFHFFVFGGFNKTVDWINAQ
jgi:methylenetetrahydrofolate reductase (NADPH)